jgi:hypothetical protein
MSEQDDKKSEVEDNETEDETESSPESAPPPKPRVKARKGAARAEVAAKPAPAPSMPASRAGLFVVLALAAGGAAGWFGHIQQAKAAHARVDATPVPSSSTGAPGGLCGQWQDKICDSVGKTSAACQQAKGAAELLTPSTCETALSALPATVTKLKAARASCDKLVSKLCTDLPPGSSTCEMVKERTPSFPAKRCDEMLQNYDKVIEELRSIDQQGGMQGGPQGMPPGAPGMPPGMPSPH